MRSCICVCVCVCVFQVCMGVTGLVVEFKHFYDINKSSILNISPQVIP